MAALFSAAPGAEPRQFCWGRRLRRLLHSWFSRDPGKRHDGRSGPNYSVPGSVHGSAYIRDPITGESYSRDVRYVAQKAEAYLKETAVGDAAYFGPELEHFVFNEVRYDQSTSYGYYEIDAMEANWKAASKNGPNLAHKLRPKEGYFPVPPADALQDARTNMVLILEQLGIPVEAHHHEVSTGGQGEIDMRFATLTRMADNVMIYKYVVKNVARKRGMTATFMPKPLFGDNGSGMHVHQSIWKDGTPVFAGNKYSEPQPGMPLLHRRAPEARAGAARDLCANRQLVPAAGARLRSAGQSRLLRAQSLGCLSHPHVLGRPQDETRRIPLPRSGVQPLPGVRGDADGGPRWYAEQH